MSRNRTAKKSLKRGRIVTPDKIMMPGDTEWIPGVPAFHRGTFEHDMTHAFDAIGVGGGGDTENRDYVNADVPQLVQWHIQGDPIATQTLVAFGIIDDPTSGGSGLGGIDPAQQQFQNELATRRADLDDRLADIQERLDANRISSTEAINLRNVVAAKAIEDDRILLQRDLAKLTQERDTLNRQQQTFQQNIGVRGQDITQRDQDISGLLAGSGQELQAQTAGGQQLGNLAGLEQNRQQFLSELSANPRNFQQLNIARGGGDNFLAALAAGAVPGGGNVQAGTAALTAADRSSLGSIFEELGTTPTFDAAQAAATQLGQFQGPELPGQVAALGPESVLTPDERAIFDQFMALAPNTPIDVAIDIARNPAASRQFLQALPQDTGTTPPGQPPGGAAITQANMPFFMQDLQQRWPNITAQDANDLRQFAELGFAPAQRAALIDAASVVDMMIGGGLSPDDALGAMIRALEPLTGVGGGIAGTGSIAGQDSSLPATPGSTAGDAPRILSQFFDPVTGESTFGDNNQLFDRIGEFLPELSDTINPNTGAGLVLREGVLDSNLHVNSLSEAGRQAYWARTTPEQHEQRVAQENALREAHRLGFNPFQGSPVPDPSRPEFPIQPEFSSTAPPPEGTREREQFDAFRRTIEATRRPPGVLGEPLAPITPAIDVSRIGLSGPVTAQDRAAGETFLNAALAEQRAGNVGGVAGAPAAPIQSTFGKKFARTKSRAGLSFAGGAQGIVTDEPIVGMGLRSGQPRFTLNEPTEEFPQGVPELIRPNGNAGFDVIPLRHGGRITIDRDEERDRRNRESGLSERDRRLGVPQPTITTPVAPVPAPVAAPVPTAPPLNIPSGPFIPPVTAGVPGAPALPPIAAQPTEPPPPTPFAPQLPAPPQPDFGALQRNLTSLRPDVFFNMSPDDIDQLFSVLSSIGVPERTARFDIERSFPRGLDPSRIVTAGF